MLLWQDVSRTDRLGPPPCLEGAADLQGREDAGGRLWAVGDGRLLGPQATGWVDLTDGWRVKALPSFDPAALARSLSWCPVAYVEDAQGRAWPVAAPRSQAGESRIVGAYDEAWNRILSEDQSRLERLSAAAREGILASVAEEGSIVAPSPPTVASVCAWAVGAICAAMHISAQALGRLTLLDEILAKRAALTVAGIVREDA